jgi:hypothetical protein
MQRVMSWGFTAALVLGSLLAGASCSGGDGGTQGGKEVAAEAIDWEVVPEEATGKEAEAEPQPEPQAEPASEPAAEPVEEVLAEPAPEAMGEDVTGPEIAAGTLSCKEFWGQCVTACPKDGNGLPESACYEGCKATLTTQGASDLDTYMGCMEQNGCLQAADAVGLLQCLLDHCQEAYFACFHGEQSCSQVLQCMGGCPQGDNGKCALECTQEGTPEAQAKLMDIAECTQQACCPTDPAQCATTEGQNCAKAALQFGGDCFGQVTACAMGQ